MLKNVGAADRVVRIVLALIAAALVYTGQVTGGTGTALIVVAVILLLTALVRFCPLYRLLGLSTCSARR